jgi:hypothetical protein
MKNHVLNVVFNYSFQKVYQNWDAPVEGWPFFGRVGALEVTFEASRDDLLRDETYGFESRLTCTRRAHADFRLLTSSSGRKSSIMRIPSVLTNILVIPQHSLFVSTTYLLLKRFWCGFLVQMICCFANPTTMQFTPKYDISCPPFSLLFVSKKQHWKFVVQHDMATY